jgi:hypothetical protein
MGDALATMSVAAMMQELRAAEAQAMKYEELCITTDNPRLQALYMKYSSNKEQRVAELQEALDKVRKRHVMIDSSDDDDD